MSLEQKLFQRGLDCCGGADEVGRGSLAGPVTVGIVLVGPGTGPVPSGLADSKLLSSRQRQLLLPAIRSWALAWAIGHAGADEIDEYGILVALHLAGWRAYQQLTLLPGHILLDGSYNWLKPRAKLFGQRPAPDVPCQVSTVVKGDQQVACIAAASVLAKEARDELMRELAQTFPAYGWEHNVGYSSPQHHQAINQHGPCEYHRRSWRPFQTTSCGIGDDDTASLD